MKPPYKALEAQLQGKILKTLNQHGFAFKNQSAPRGFPDLTFIRADGKVFFIEVKRNAYAKLSQAQELRIAQLKELNANVFLFTKLEDIKQCLE